MDKNGSTGNRFDRIKEWLAYFWPFLAAYLVVKIIQIVLYPDPYQMSDTSDYLKSAVLLRTNPFRPLGYSLFLAFSRLLLPFPLGVSILQSAVKLAVTAALGGVLRSRYPLPRRGVLFVCLIVTLNPTALLYDFYLISDSLFTSCTIGLFAALLAYVKKPSWAALAAAAAFAVLAAATRFVGLTYPPLVLVFIALYGRRRRLLHGAVIALVTAALLVGTGAKTKQDLKVFKLTVFDGWALHGNLGHLLPDIPWDLARIDDPETRLVCNYIMSFPLDEMRGRHWDFFRFHHESPAKNLLNAFIPNKERPDAVTARRDSTFLYAFMTMARTPSTPAQKLFHRYRAKNLDLFPYAMNYWGSFIVTNELLRKSNKEFMRQHRWEYIRRFYSVSLRKLFFPNEPPVDGGLYRRRETADLWVERFWPGEDSSTWWPRFGDVLGDLNWTHQWFVPLVWLAAVVSLVSACRRRRPPGMRGWRLLIHPGVVLLAFAVSFGAATAYSHMMIVRYTSPIMTMVVIAAALLLNRDTPATSCHP
jgi:hypothetical protein